MKWWPRINADRFCLKTRSSRSRGKLVVMWMMPLLFTGYDNKEYIKKYDIDIIVHGDDWDGEGYWNRFVSPGRANKHHVSMVYLPYTKGISTSELVEKIKSIKIMYYKTINVPIVLEVGEDIFVHLRY